MIKVSLVPYPNCGLCNQLYYLASTFIDCLIHHKKEFMVHGMLQEINTHVFVPISNVLNIGIMNNYLPVKIMDGFRDKGPFIQPSSWNLLSEYPDIATKFYKHIRFSNAVIYPTRSIPPQIDYMIHIRLEPDAIEHWSKINNVTEEEFKTRVEKWYIETIDKNIPIGSQVLVLTGDTNNAVWNYIYTKYNVYHLKKPGIPREIAAAMDLSMSQKCKKLFIGAGGSTFTDFIMKTRGIIGIMFDLNHIP